MDKMQKYLKEKENRLLDIVVDTLIRQFSCRKSIITKRNIICLILTIVTVIGILSYKMSDNINYDDIQITYVGLPLAATGAKIDHISIPNGTVKANPFLPYRSLDNNSDKVSDVPAFELIAPPETVNENSDAARVMDTIVSGILYDKYSPSAILNIEGNDYLVKKGDIVNNYRVLDISQNSVSVKLGNNTYKAGIGEILTEGVINYNEVSNLSRKFGGEKR